MITVARFTFNPFQENTYVLYDETKECIIFDPGCHNDHERNILDLFIEKKELKPVQLINTHCHIDHILGNQHVSEKYGLPLTIHKGEIPVLEAVPMYAKSMGLEVEHFPATAFLEEGDIVKFGQAELKVLFTPGHSPASISFYCEEDKLLIAGDVLFEGSIGRTDLPGGDFQTLYNTIHEKFFPLGDDVEVFPGHGPSTKIGIERIGNPFVGENSQYTS